MHFICILVSACTLCFRAVPTTHGKEEYIAAITAAQTTVNQNIEAAKAKAIDLTLDVRPLSQDFHFPSPVQITRLKEIYYAIHEDKAVSVLNREAGLAQQQFPQQSM